MPEISVIVPVYRVKPYLHRCVDSILAQTYSDFDLILIDDGCPDGCGAVCDEYAQKDARIHVIHQNNGGLSSARNTGINWSIKNSKSEWISFVDSDDWIHPRYLELLIAAAGDTQLDVIIGGYFRTNGETFPEPERHKERAVIRPADDYYVKSIVNATVSWGKLVRKKYYEEIQFPVGKVHEDEFTTYKILFRQKNLAVVDLPLYAYFQNKQGIMMKPWSPSRLDAMLAMDEQLSFFHKLGRKEIEKVVLKRYLNSISRNLIAIQESSALQEKDRDHYRKLLEKRRRRLLLTNRRLFPVFESEENKEVYYEAFPIMRTFSKLWTGTRGIMKRSALVHAVGKKVKRVWLRREDIRTAIRYKKATAFKKAVLLQTPIHGNLGDHAIAMAEMQMFEKLCISCCDFPYTKGIEKWCAAVTSRKKLIVITGGGFMGSLWMNEEWRIRDTLRFFSKNKVIIFPQTVYFDFSSPEGRECFEASKRYYENHPDLTLFVREKQSYDFVRQYMPEINVHLVPDTVMVLDYQTENRKRDGALVCMRKDKERLLPDEDYQNLVDILEKRYSHVRVSSTIIPGPIKPERRNQEVSGKLEEFASAEVAITDRLHGMIFAAVTETPCIVMDSLSHKLRGCYRWLEDLDYIKFCSDIRELPGMVEELKEITPGYNRKKMDAAMRPLYQALREGIR